MKLHKPIFTVSGTVEHGNRKGRTLGFPTANLVLDESAPIPYGVYLSQTVLEDGRRVWGVTNVGIRPTMTRDVHATAETHLFCDACDLYAKQIRVELIAFMREEKCFESPIALAKQIRADLLSAKERIKIEESV